MTFEIKQYEDIVNDIVQRLLTENTNITDLNESSVIRMLIETYSLELESEEFIGIYQQIRNVYDASKISTATGNDLDEIAKLVGTSRGVGTKAIVDATLIRVTPTLVDFTVIAGTVIANQPFGTEEQIRFLSLADAEFIASILNEEQTFVNGIYDYKLNQRFYDTITEAKAIFSTVETIMTKNVDYEEVKTFEGNIIDVDTIVVVDGLDAVTGWTGSADAFAPSVDSVNKRQGTASLTGGKSNTTTAFFYYEKTYVSGFDLSAKEPNLKIRIASQTQLDKIAKVTVLIGDSAIDYLSFDVLNSELQVGWNELYLDTDDAISVGNPQIGDIKYVRVQFDTNTAADTIPDGDINIDFIIFAEIEIYEGDILRMIDTGVLPDDPSIMKISYVPLSLEVQFEAEDIGSIYNVTKNSLTFKVTALSNIVSTNNYEAAFFGTDIESDDDFRQRMVESTSGLGKATVDAITNAVLSIDFVTSAKVIDMPLKNNTEFFIYSTVITEYQLAYEVALQNAELNLTTEKSILDGAITDVQTTIDLIDSTGYSTSGYVLIEDELIFYDGIATNTLQNCIRGSLGTTELAHDTGLDADQWFLPGTDFNINEESKIVWTLTGNEPADTEQVDVFYEYRWLAHIDVFAVGSFTFTSEQNTIITDTIEETKAAGIAYNYAAPTLVNVNVTADVNIESGFVFDSVKAEVITNLTNKLESYSIGEEVYISQLIEEIMKVEGVNYTNITAPSGTVIIADDEIAKAGTIIINQI